MPTFGNYLCSKETKCPSKQAITCLQTTNSIIKKFRTKKEFGPEL